MWTTITATTTAPIVLLVFKLSVFLLAVNVNGIFTSLHYIMNTATIVECRFLRSHANTKSVNMMRMAGRGGTGAGAGSR